MIKYLPFFFLVLRISIYPQYSLGGLAPLQPNNYWIYGDYNGNKYSARVLDSTVVLDSNLFYVVKGVSYLNGSNFPIISFGHFRLDSSKFYIQYNPSLYINKEGKYYKIEAKKNDSWINEVTINPGTFYYKIVDTMTTKWNGYLTKAKEVEVTDSGLFDQYQYWSDDFGVIQVIDFEGASEFLIACVINGKEYGDTTLADIIEIKKNIPKKFYLFQNYPNPFNPSTKINFDIPETDFVTLKVYDILGREIRTLINKEMMPGGYGVNFNSNGLSSGIYIYVLKTSKYSAVNKMILIK